VRGVPQGETPRSAPPPPVGSPARTQTQQPVPQQSAALPPPSLPPVPDPAFAGGGAALPSGAGVTLGTVLFEGTSARLSAESLAQVREVAALRQQNGGGTIRVTGYSVPQGEQDTMAPQLASFNLALDRARAVAAALTQSGVPARAVEIGASPPPPGQAGGAVEILLEP
jgi:outer membrane protein OmpA-like peptidoglycan-associated protein